MRTYAAIIVCFCPFLIPPRCFFLLSIFTDAILYRWFFFASFSVRCLVFIFLSMHTSFAHFSYAYQPYALIMTMCTLFLLFLANTEHLNFCEEFDAVGFVFTGHVSVISSMCIKPHCQPEYFSIYIQILIVPLFSVGKHFFILRGINSVEKIKTKTKWDKKNNHPKWMPLLGINLSKYQFDGTFNNAGIFILLR